MIISRRSFGLGAASFAFAGLTACAGSPAPRSTSLQGYGPLLPDPAGLLDLPRGFSYRVLSKLGDPMDDGDTVPDAADGMGCFAGPQGTLILVRNHELKRTQQSASGFAPAARHAHYDHDAAGVLPGGTTTIHLDPATGEVRRQFRSLAGTIRNCAGGTTPWGSWLTCEEDTQRAGEGLGQDHGYLFEVPATARRAVHPVPLRAMGRFNHEAAAVDPRTGIVYLTEDRADGLLYRFIPTMPGVLSAGGRLQALAIKDTPDTRNWQKLDIAPRHQVTVRWIDLDDVESPADDLRRRGAASGAALFARGEGIHMGDGELFFTCTSGGAARVGQVFRLRPGRTDTLTLYYESPSADEFNFGDNLTVAPNGSLIVCEDQYSDVVDNHLRLITPAGASLPFGRLRLQTELAGVCFSPDGKHMFVNCFSPAKTLMINGPW